MQVELVRATAPAATDLTADGVDDLVIGTHDGRLMAYQNMGGGVFSPMNASEGPFEGIFVKSGHAAPAFGDFDGDGLYTLHPTPYTLRPIPCTLHPRPYRDMRRRRLATLMATDCTPETLHPAPYTLHPTP